MNEYRQHPWNFPSIQFKQLFFLLLVFIPLLFIHCDKSLTGSSENNPEMQLCYQSYSGVEHWQIFTNTMVGDAPVNISNNPYYDAYDPLWSPDGRYIAYRYDLGGSADIVLYDVEQDTARNITKFKGSESAYPLLWSPDGEQLVYHYHLIGEEAYYGIMQRDGFGKQKLFNTDAGHIIAFDDQGAALLWSLGQQLYRLDPTTHTDELLLDYSQYSANPTWTDDYDPQSNTVLCHEDTSTWGAGASFLIKTINLNTLQIDTLVQLPQGPVRWNLLRPVFSNDGSQVAYILWDFEHDMYRLLLYNNGRTVEVDRLTFPYSYAWYPLEFSPNDRYLSYTVMEDDTTGYYYSFTRSVYVCDIAAKQSHFVAEGCDSHWNPRLGK